MIAKEGENCFGFIYPMPVCESGLKCVRTPGMPSDVGGICKKQ